MGLLETALGIAETGRISVETVVDASLGRMTAERSDERLQSWSRKLLADAEVRLEVRGREHAGDGLEPFIVMSNHQSLYDVPVIYQSVPGRIRMVAKAELFRVPIWGRAMLASGFIRVDRADRHQAMTSLRMGRSLLDGGTRVWIAPEGTRSRTGKLGPFKSGGFHMALEAGVRILPVAIEGTRHVLKAQGLMVHTGKAVTATILSPIDAAAYGAKERKALTAAVRNAIAGALGQPTEAVEPAVQAE